MDKSIVVLVGMLLFMTTVPVAGGQSPISRPERTGKQLYEAACAACHASSGKGAPLAVVGFDTPIPDFTDCTFASRETNQDWIAVVHGGGPARRFDRMMPAFGDALTTVELHRVVTYVRTFCSDDSWPRGELNLPRPLVTEKAYPEDEAVLTVAASIDEPAAFNQRLVYERRIGPRNQIEIIVPFGLRQRAPGRWVGGIGDFALGFKRDVWHSFSKGSIFSVGGEVAFPTGDRNKGLGSGKALFEPFVAFGQILPSDGFVQFHGGFEIPVDRVQSRELFWRTAFGKSFMQRGFGRSWSPMLEVLGARKLRALERVEWDVVPQLQVSLSRRQHVILSAGVRVPVNDTRLRATQVMFYLLWDWFDGGLLSGW